MATFEEIWPAGKRGGPSQTRAWMRAHAAFAGEQCLPWPFSRKSDGYGQVIFRGKNVRAHRVMCMVAHGQPSHPGYLACHTCGKGHEGCVNPRHLRWASAHENMADKVTHGTHNRGERNVSATLTDLEASAIFVLKGRLPPKEVARLFGVSAGTVYSIQTGAAYKHSWLAPQKC